MDPSTLRHRVTIAPWDEWNFHAFVRSDDGTIEHYWPGDDGVMFGPEELGGHFDTDPVAAWRFSPTGIELHLVGRSGAQLVDWMWQHPGSTPLPLLGQPTVLVLPGLAVAEPEVIDTAGRIDVFAPSLDGPMRHWFLLSPDDGWQGPEVLTTDPAEISARPCAVSRTPGSFDVFCVDTDNAGLRHWFNDENGWHSEHLTRTAAGQRLAGPIAAAASNERRLDVFAVRTDGVPIHWGWDGREWFPDEERLGSPGVLLDGELALITVADKQLTFVARLANPTGAAPGVVTWELDPRPPASWRGPSDITAAVFPVNTWPTARAGSGQPDEFGHESPGRRSMLVRSADGSFTHTMFRYTDEHSIDGRPMWESDDFLLLRTEPEPPPASFVPATVAPDLLARRPDDLVLLGVRWNEHVEALPGPPGELLAHAGAELVVTLPPQHVAEQVVAADGPVQPPIDPQFTGGVPLWGSSLSGPSQVVVGLPEGTRVPLTVAGVLEALRTGRLLPSADLTDPHTQLELPYHLLMTPFRPDGGAITLDHATSAVAAPTGSVGLWNTRIAAAGTDRADRAGLTLRPLGVGTADPFPTSLSGGSRARILAEEPIARIDRLRLSALGGSLTASGAWPTFEWDHHAVLGRDQTVRTAMSGVLYPFGHRAVYVETSERRLETTAQGSIAHLRKRRVLIITEPVRQYPPSRAFPFTEARFQRTLVEFADDPPFATKPFRSPAADQLAEEISALIGVADLLRPAIDGGDLGPAPDRPPVEDLAFFDFGFPPEVTAAAEQFVGHWVEIRRIQERLAALAAGGIAPVPVHLVPDDAGGPIRFPVQLSGTSGTVHVAVPVVFVVDVRLPEGLLHPAYRSLDDPEIQQAVADAYTSAGDGDVEIAPMRLDLVGSAQPRPADTPEVRRLHLVGEPRDGGFGPRLGIAPVDGETVPAARRWAVELAMTELATLAGQPPAQGSPTLRVALSPELLAGAPDPGLLFRAPEGAAALATAFSANSARSGGLAAPDLVIDGISRSQGPVRAESFLQQLTTGHPDPARFLGDTATLLGFRLTDLIDASSITGSPQILADPTPGAPPKVTMTWPSVPLTSSGSFLATDASSMTIEVTLSPDTRSVRCTVHDVALAFPDPADKLLEVAFERIEFRQEGGGVPSIDVDVSGTTFFGFLQLLERLQDAVVFDGGAPAIHASERGVTATFDLPVPDVTTGAFQLTGLTFHGVVDVPFDARPVTIGLAFASREDPFNVSVLALGGGGYVDIVLDKTGLRRLELALEFGASLELDFVVATGEVHVMGGIKVVTDPTLSLAAYLRFGGMVEILGLVSVSVELVATLTWVGERRALVGRATLVLELDLLLFSDSVELDSGEWVIGGDETPASQPLPGPPPAVEPELPMPLGLEAFERTPARVFAPAPAVDPDAWRAYRAAFDTEALA